MAGAGPVDVRILEGRIVEVGTGLVPAPGVEVLDASGRAVLPGLHDHHVHLRAWAAAAASVPVGPPEVRTAEQVASRLRAAAAAAAPGTWVRAVGYHDSVAGPLDRWVLDRLTGRPDIPVRVQHRSGVLWILNSAGIDALGLSGDGGPTGVERDEGGRPTGRIWREDRWLATRLPRQPVDYRPVGAKAAAWGVSGFTDATPDQTTEDLAGLAHASEQGWLPQRLHLMAPVGVSIPAAAKVTRGPVKVMLDDDALPSLDELTDAVRCAHQEGRGAAVHCVTLVQATFALAAFEGAGRTGPNRIEHGAVLSPALIDTLRRLAVTVVTQPGFVAARGDQYRRDVEPADQPDLWRCASLMGTGVEVAAGTDAPFGPADPWASIQAATDRRTADGDVLGPAEGVPPGAALDLWTGPADRPGGRRRIAPGQAADLCILAEPTPPAPVVATIVAGEVIYRIS